MTAINCDDADISLSWLIMNLAIKCHGVMTAINCDDGDISLSWLIMVIKCDDSNKL